MRKLPFLLIAFSAMTLASCNKDKYNGQNPFFVEWDTPFGVPPFDAIKAEHYKPAFEKAMELYNADIDAIVNESSSPSFENTILAFDNAGEMYGTVSRIFSLIMSADSNDELRAVEKEMTPIMTKHSDDIYLNERLFDKIAAVYRDMDGLGLDSLQQRLTGKIYRRFENAGAALTPQGKEALRSINERLSLAEVRFADNVLKATAGFQMVVDTADIIKLPSGIRESAAAAAAAAGHKGRYMFTLSKPSMLPFLTNSENRELRERLYRGYIERCNGGEYDNLPVVKEIVELRVEKARLLGYDTYADYMLVNRMAESPQAVYDLLDGLWSPSLARAKEELEEMKEIKLSETADAAFESWDWWYYAEKVRKKKYSLDEEMLKPYFSLQNVQSGIHFLCNRLYGLTFKPLSGVPVYNSECSVFEVLDRDNTHLGVLIMDFYIREGRKKVGAWCGSYRTRTHKEGITTDPIVTIVCNYPRPVGDKPVLLTLDETETFFHEFGHAIHALMTNVPYKGLQRVEQDFVELPSQIMENWAFEPQMLRRYALHHTTKNVIPDNLIDKIGNSSAFNQGFVLTELLAASLSDMDIHTLTDPSALDVNAFEREMLNVKRGLINEIEPRYRYPYFNHIFRGSSYSAGYYSYIWAEVLDKDAYEAFMETGNIFNEEVAASFRKNILEKGGSEDGMTMYRNFRGADPAKEPILYGRGLVERPAREADDFPYMGNGDLSDLLPSDDEAFMPKRPVDGEGEVDSLNEATVADDAVAEKVIEANE